MTFIVTGNLEIKKGEFRSSEPPDDPLPYLGSIPAPQISSRADEPGAEIDSPLAQKIHAVNSGF